MTNEQLAELIQEGGNDELLSLLWDKTKSLIFKKCGTIWRFYSKKLERFGYSLEDLQQESYNALIFAVKGYKAEKGYMFTTYLSFAIKRIVRGLLSGGSDVLNLPTTQNLDQPLGESDNGKPLTFGDIVPDESAAAVFENIERLDEYDALYEAIDTLPTIERSVIIEHYFKELSFTKIGKLHGFTKSRAQQAHKRAIQLLRSGQTGRRLFEIYGREQKCRFDGSIRIPKHKGLQAFKRSHTSEIEDYVIWLLSRESKKPKGRN